MSSPRIVALEEHFWTPDLKSRYVGRYGVRAPRAVERLSDLADMRLREMDEAGIDVQVLSHVQPGVQIFDPQTATRLAREANDFLRRAIDAHPDRFAGFAQLPTPDPEAAAAELERAVAQLGFKGALVNGLSNDEFLDERKFWCIFERAQALDVPIYLHPGIAHAGVASIYYQDYPALAGPLWGFTAETAVQAIRLVLSGVLDAYPRLKFILGHMGETLPFALQRLDYVHKDMPGTVTLKRSFAAYFHENFWLTTSGNFSHPALVCAVMEMGIDRVMFSVDWPYCSNVDGVRFVESAPLGEDEKAKILGGTAAQFLRL